MQYKHNSSANRLQFLFSLLSHFDDISILKKGAGTFMSPDWLVSAWLTTHGFLPSLCHLALSLNMQPDEDVPYFNVFVQHVITSSPCCVAPLGYHSYDNLLGEISILWIRKNIYICMFCIFDKMFC